MSIRLRLTLWYAAAIAFTILLLCAGLWLALQHSILLATDQELRTRVDAVRHYLIEQQHEGETSDIAQEMAEDLDAVAGTALLRISTGDGTWLYRSRGATQWNIPVLAADMLPPEGTVQTVAVPGHSIRLLSARLSIGVLQVGLQLDRFAKMQDLLAATVFISSPFLILLASAAGYWMSGKALHPVHQLSVGIRSIGVSNLSERLPQRGTRDELDQLAELINDMLSRLESGFLSIARFTSDASHELRTPVTIIRTTAEVELMKPDMQPKQAWQVVLKQTARVHQLIEDLLVLARADAGSQDLSYEFVDASVLVESACEEVQILAHAAGLQFRCHIEPNCVMFGDPDDLRRIIFNLLENAVKYTRSPGRVEVTAGIGSGPNKTFTLTVRDSGVGIPEADLPHIFDRFYRVAQDRSRKTGGAGLGLAIARRLAERHNGSITVTSVLGEGSTFTLTLPLNVTPTSH